MRVGHDHVDGVWNPGPWTHVERAAQPPRRVARRELSPGGLARGLGRVALRPRLAAVRALPGRARSRAAWSSASRRVAPLTFTHRYRPRAATTTDARVRRRAIEVSQNGGGVRAGGTGGRLHARHGLLGAGLPEVRRAGAAGSPHGARSAWTCRRSRRGRCACAFRMGSDLFVGAGGWWLDDIRFPLRRRAHAGRGAARARGGAGPRLAQPGARPHSTSPLRLARAARVEMVALRRRGPARSAVVTLGAARLAVARGAHELGGTPARESLAGGLFSFLYFSARERGRPASPSPRTASALRSDRALRAVRAGDVSEKSALKLELCLRRLAGRCEACM
jgi:hypothetical protein